MDLVLTVSVLVGGGGCENLLKLWFLLLCENSDIFRALEVAVITR
jgi:hypothetical protein